MAIIITQWGLNAYLDLRGTVFTQSEFNSVIKPDVYLLRDYPLAPKFKNGKFWSRVGPKGFKMKWHQVGNGKVQLRLLVGLINNDFYLCQAYAKRDEKCEKRQLAKFKTYLELIHQQTYNHCGVLT